MCFPVNIVKCLRATILKNNHKRLLLEEEDFIGEVYNKFSGPPNTKFYSVFMLGRRRIFEDPLSQKYLLQ